MSTMGSALVPGLVGAVALMVGLVLGGIGPRAELRELRSELTELAAKPCRSAVGPGIASVLSRGALGGGAPARAPVLAEPAAAPVKQEAEGEWRSEGEGEGTTVQWSFGEDAGGQDTPEGGVDAMRQALAVRKAQARAALREQGDLDDGQLAAIDAAVEEMNLALTAVAADLQEQGQLATLDDRRSMLYLAADSLDAVIEADSRIRETLSPEQLAAVEDEAVDPLSYLDPSVLERFMGTPE